MLTFTLQCVLTVLTAVTALLCLRAGAARPSGNVYHDTAWRLTGAGFLLHSLDKGIQNLFGGIAIAAGNSSEVMHAYTRLSPVMNHSRTFLIDGLMVALVILALYRRAPDRRLWSVSWIALGAGFLLGVGLGVLEGRFTQVRHYTAVATWDLVELFFLFAALFALLLTNRADRLLWGWLAAYGVGLALGIFWFVLFTRLKLPGAWVPPTWSVHVERIFFRSLMLGLVLRRLALVRRGRTLRGMSDTAIRPLPSLH